MYYEDLEIGSTASSFKIVSDIDFAGASPHMWAASHAERLLKTTLPGPGCKLLSFYASFANEPKIHDKVEVAVTINGFHPMMENVVNFSVSLDSGGEPVLAGRASVWVPNKPTT